MDRRKFVKILGVGAAATAIPWKFSLRQGLQSNSAWAFYQSQNLQLWQTTLRGVGPSGIPLATPDGTTSPVTGITPHYTMNIGQFTDQLHPAFGTTTLWGYNPADANGVALFTPRHLGGIIVAQKGVPIQLTFRNNLPAKHIIPVDVSANFPDAAHSQNTAAVHMHGGLTVWYCDGTPFTDFPSSVTPTVLPGPSFMNNIILNPGAPNTQAEYFYGMNQSARLLWYHDHSHDLTRINAYAGIASACILRDTFEAGLIGQGLPDYIENGGREIPIVIQDKIFVGSNIQTLDPTWVNSLNMPSTPGSLWYPHIYEKNRWKLNGSNKGVLPVPDPSCIPEMFGDTMLANGTVYPSVPVEARRYRFRVLNACNARFLNLQLYVDDKTSNGITLNAAGAPTNAKGPDFLVIGTEGGFLPQPVNVVSNIPFNPLTLGGSLITGPAERWDLIVDFTGFAGKNIILYSDTPAPFPIGDPRNDYFPGLNVKGNPVNALTPAGSGPNTREIMRFVVGAATSADLPLTITTSSNLQAGNDPLFYPPGMSPVSATGLFTPPAGITIRPLTLNETFDQYGRLIQMLGTNVSQGKNAGFGQPYLSGVTETPANGTTEVWEIANLTGDTHPIHFHLVNVQILARQPFKVGQYNGTPSFTGPARPPDPTESGWKETVRMNPGEVIWVMMHFLLPPNPPNVVPTGANNNLLSPRTGGHEYVWHCHILEHEEHDMMRALVIP